MVCALNSLNDYSGGLMMILTDLPEVKDNGDGEGEDEDTLSKSGAPGFCTSCSIV